MPRNASVSLDGKKPFFGNLVPLANGRHRNVEKPRKSLGGAAPAQDFLEDGITHATCLPQVSTVTQVASAPNCVYKLSKHPCMNLDMRDDIDLKDLLGFIRRERTARGWSQRTLADTIGVSHGLVGQWEAGSTPVTTAKFLDVCSAFGISPSVLFGEGQPLAGRLVSDPAEWALVVGWRRLDSTKKEAVRLVLAGLGFPIPAEVDKS